MSRSALAVGGASLLLLLSPVGAWAGRPLETEDAGTEEPAKASLELGGEYADNPADDSGTFQGVLSVGLLPRVEARVESEALWLDPEGERGRAGIGDSLFGIKYRPVDEAAHWPAVLGSLTVRLPTGDEERDLGDNEVDVGLLAVVSKRVGLIRLTWNGGYTFVTRDRDLEFWTFDAAVEYGVVPAWIVVAEAVSQVGTESEPDTVVLRVGSVYAISGRVDLDGAVGVGVTRESPDVSVTVGVTIKLF